MHRLSNSNNLGEWKNMQSQFLAERVQKDFYELQNPSDCTTAKKLLCDLTKSCGYGCQMHHIMYCFIVAHFTKRTMILQSDGWKYDPKGLTAYYLPLSETCTDMQGQEVTAWNRKLIETRLV